MGHLGVGPIWCHWWGPGVVGVGPGSVGVGGLWVGFLGASRPVPKTFAPSFYVWSSLMDTAPNFRLPIFFVSRIVKLTDF